MTPETQDALLRALCKPLAWDGSAGQCYLRAITPFGVYWISVEYGDEWYCDYTDNDSGRSKRLSGNQDGPVVPQAAAEADYRAKIAAALNLDAVAELVEAAESLMASCRHLYYGSAFEKEFESEIAALARFRVQP